MKTAVIAIGGNAISRKDQRGTVEEQVHNMKICCEMIADLVEDGYQLVLTHGNGPQVGSIVIQNEAAGESVPENPLDVCGAQTQGSLGYLLSRTLINTLEARHMQKKLAAVLMQVVVDREDAAFQNPSKYIGPFFSEEEAERLEEQKGYRMCRDSDRGYRRVVPSPMQVEIVEEEAILTLLKEDFLVITAGGGGIPVIRERNGLEGIEAVIDKDLASGLLAERIHADLLVMLTGVPKVAVNYGKEDMEELGCVSPGICRKYMKEGQFPPGSMGPKVEAACRFAEREGKEAVITSMECMRDALGGRAGTHIRRKKPEA